MITRNFDICKNCYTLVDYDILTVFHRRRACNYCLKEKEVKSYVESVYESIAFDVELIMVTNLYNVYKVGENFSLYKFEGKIVYPVEFSLNGGEVTLIVLEDIKDNIYSNKDPFSRRFKVIDTNIKLIKSEPLQRLIRMTPLPLAKKSLV